MKKKRNNWLESRWKQWQQKKSFLSKLGFKLECFWDCEYTATYNMKGKFHDFASQHRKSCFDGYPEVTEELIVKKIKSKEFYGLVCVDIEVSSIGCGFLYCFFFAVFLTSQFAGNVPKF